MTITTTCGTFEIDKDPQADLDYRFDWRPWLLADTIVSSTWEVQLGSGLTMHDSTIEDSDTETVVWLAGGVVSDVAWRVTNTIVTAAGRTEERSLMVRIKER